MIRTFRLCALWVLICFVDVLVRRLIESRTKMPTQKKCHICKEKIGVASKTCQHCGAKQPYKQKLEKHKTKVAQAWRDRQKKNCSLNKVYDATNLLLHKWEVLERHPVLLLARRTPNGFLAECLCPWQMDSEDAQDALVTLKRIYERLLNEPSQPFDCKEEVPSEQQEWSPSLVQGEPKPPHIKEEENELWSSREEEQLQGPEVLPVTPGPVRSKNGDVKAQSSHLHQSQTGNNRETSPSTDQMKTEPDGEDCGLSEPASNLDPAANLQPNSDGEPLSSDGCESSETEDSDDGWNQAEDAQSGLDGIKNEISPQRCAEMKPFSCFVCGKGFSRRDYAQKHMRIHDRKKPFTCSVCGKGFSQRGWMRRHMKIHPGEKPFDCSVCGKCFTRRDAAETHARVHTGEKPFGCPFCCKRFSNRWGMTKHARVHTGQKPFSCSVCEKGFSSGKQMERHMRTHAAEKPFSCSVW